MLLALWIESLPVDWRPTAGLLPHGLPEVKSQMKNETTLAAEGGSLATYWCAALY